MSKCRSASLNFLLLLIVLVSGCKEEVLIPEQHLSLSTLPVTDISEAGAVFHAGLSNSEKKKL
ncbi:hypothetical protein [Nafulsella turpanensis]|uniref:hypothetical protein n=1 Tax=Nafulsella turpanensis TaxID=1265690 RepID=UPI0003472CBE|nr:hypothetical protein [Nafulsella turpanensis]